MSPIVHAELSWLLAQALPNRRERVLVTLAGLAPDLDGLSLLAGLDAYEAYHHVLSHGFPAALAITLLCLSFARARRALTGLLALSAFHLHLLCDLAGSGPGWPILYFWPASRIEWFWSGQWDLASWQNGVIGLAATLSVLATALVSRRTLVELLSPRWDALVTATLRARFLGERLAPVTAPLPSQAPAPAPAAAQGTRPPRGDGPG